LPQGRLDAETTFNVGTIQGGTVRNAVPAECTFVGEFRSRNKQTLERVQRQLVETLEQARRRNPEAKIEDRMEVEFEGYSVSVEDPLVVKAGAVLATLGLEARPGSSGGGTDANVFTRSGIKAVVVGMASQGMHTVGEHVRIPDLVNAARFCEALVTAR
jgi:tripeptide aminopeptidase